MMGKRVQITAEDRVQHEAWVAGQVQHVENVLRVDVWNFSAMRRAGVPIRDTVDAWRGPWFTVRPWVTTEFRELVEQGHVQRWTVTQWAEANAATRAAVEAEEEDAESREALRSLAYWRELTDRRGEMIATARTAGIPWSVICAESGLSRSQAADLLAKHERAARAWVPGEDDAF